jgi:hypothetical protein
MCGKITVLKIDFNPVDSQFHGCSIDKDGFYRQLKEDVKKNPRFNAKGFEQYLYKWDNMISEVQKAEYEKKDINELTKAITEAIQTAYKNQGLVLTNRDMVTTLHDCTLNALVDNIKTYEVGGMTWEEEKAFDSLVMATGADNMSRAKKAPSQISYGNLPKPVAQGVDGVLRTIREENNLWTNPRYIAWCVAANADPAEFVIFMSSRLKKSGGYQGNHTNIVKWLPKVILPVNNLQALIQPVVIAICAEATNLPDPEVQRRLQSNDPLAELGLKTNKPNLYTGQFIQLVGNYLQAHPFMPGDFAALRSNAWVALAQNVSAYIEFNMPGAISRLLYDIVNNRIYICAHYKWRKGYNPFFEVLQFPAVV